MIVQCETSSGLTLLLAGWVRRIEVGPAFDASTLQRLVLLCYKVDSCLCKVGFRRQFPMVSCCAHEHCLFGVRRASETLCGLSRSPGAGRRAC